MKSFLELTKERYSVREYLPKNVEEEKLAYVMECVRMAPSACNNQPWRFVVIMDRAVLERVVYAAYNRPWIRTAPAVIVCCGDHAASWKRRADGVDHAAIDVAIATEHLCLAAAEQGLGTCWVCNYDVPAVAQGTHRTACECRAKRVSRRLIKKNKFTCTSGRKVPCDTDRWNSKTFNNTIYECYFKRSAFC